MCCDLQDLPLSPEDGGQMTLLLQQARALVTSLRVAFGNQDFCRRYGNEPSNNETFSLWLLSLGTLTSAQRMQQLGSQNTLDRLAAGVQSLGPVLASMQRNASVNGESFSLPAASSFGFPAGSMPQSPQELLSMLSATLGAQNRHLNVSGIQMQSSGLFSFHQEREEVIAPPRERERVRARPRPRRPVPVRQVVGGARPAGAVARGSDDGDMPELIDDYSSSSDDDDDAGPPMLDDDDEDDDDDDEEDGDFPEDFQDDEDEFDEGEDD